MLCAAALLAALPLCGQQPASASDAKKRAADQRRAAIAVAAAQEAIERKDYATAVTLLETFLLEHPGHAEPLFNLAYVYSLQGRQADAVEMYRQTLEVDPKLLPARLNLGLLLLDAGKPAEAAAEFQQALELQPDHYGAHLYLATALERQDQKDQALAHYRRAAALDSTRAAPRRAALDLLLEKEDLTGAEMVLEELLALQPDDPALLRLRGDLRLQQGKTEEALAAYEKYLQARPEDAPVHLAVGRLYRQLEQPEQALEHFRAAAQVPVAPDSADATHRQALEERADILGALERWEEAIPAYQEAIKKNPTNAALQANLGFCYLQNHQYQEATRAFLRALKLDPKRVQTYQDLASALYLSGNLAGAIQALDRRAAYAEETPGTLYLRATWYDKLNQCLPAIEYYEKFLAVNRSTNSDPYFIATGRLRLLKKTCRQRRR